MTSKELRANAKDKTPEWRETEHVRGLHRALKQAMVRASKHQDEELKMEHESVTVDPDASAFNAVFH